MSERLRELNAVLQSSAQAADGFLPFDRLMHHALYEPDLGYYASTTPVGSAAQGGDFVTAPQLSQLFGTTLAQAIAPAFEAGLALRILECGAGTGKLAEDIIARFSAMGYSNLSYSILEVSTRLRAQQQETLQRFACVEWLDALPESFEGIILGNELLDAMPVQAYAMRQTADGPAVLERGVVWQAEQGHWQWAARSMTQSQQAPLLALLPSETQQAEYYEFEVGAQASAWISSAAEVLRRGLIILVDYGFPRAELYHPQRAGGTLMAHYKHQASSQLLENIGAADLTAHVDFSAVAKAGQAAGLELLGYTSQARFLINAGIGEAYAQAALNADTLAQAKLSRGLQYLISEAEMGELFKVIALGKDCAPPLGFSQGNRSHRLNDAI